MTLVRRAGRLVFVPIVLLAAVTLAAAAEDRSSPLPAQMPLGTEACFGRVYDAAHLARHPRQRVTSFHLFRDFSPDKNAEDESYSADELRGQDGEHGAINLTAYVRLRDRKGVYSNGFSCTKDPDGRVQCAIDCDGGTIALKPEGDRLNVTNHGFVVVGGCSASDEDEEMNPVVVKPGSDDKTFLLDKQPLAQCVAQRDAQLPVWAKRGPPLRERLAKDGALCLTRSYDAKHLATHPKQNVKRIAVLEAPPGEKQTPPGYNFIVRAELRNGQKVEGRTACWPDQYAYVCPITTTDEAASFQLTRAGEDVMLRDLRGSLAKVVNARLGTDDRMFRLQPAAESACALP